MTPSATMLDHMRAELRAREPFARMRSASIDLLVASARQTYYAPGELVLSPPSGVVQRLAWIRRGMVVGHADASGGFQCEAGEMFPLGAVMGERAVTSTYEAEGDLFCLEFDAAAVRKVVASDAVFADYVNRRLHSFLTLSRAQLQAAYSSQVLAEQSFDAELATLPRRAPVAVGPRSPLREGLARMQERRVGSVMVVDDDGAALGILTRHDLLDRIALHQPPMDIGRVAIGEVMTAPVHTIDIGARVHDAAILMSRFGIRHVPITEQGRVVSIISERDLFALQRLSLKGLSASLRHAPDVDAVLALAPGVREFARHLLAQGLASLTLTALVSHLNDLLTQRLVELTAARHGLDLARACWLAFGSEGRGEQTIATDQDNGLVLVDEADDGERSRWLAFGREVNHKLDACGYPLCKGGVMAGNEDCCLRLHQWHARFERWIEQGAPEDLLNASIYFDLRPLAGNAALAAPLREFVATRAAAVPRFLRQLAENSLRLRPALNWRGAIDTQSDDGHEWIDLKMNGTAVFVDAARLFALAKGIGALGTRDRLTLAGEQLGASEGEREGWASAFEVLQLMRLRIQVDTEGRDPGSPNRLDVAGLNEIDRHLLKESLRVARRVQQRVQLDWMR